MFGHRKVSILLLGSEDGMFRAVKVALVDAGCLMHS